MTFNEWFYESYKDIEENQNGFIVAEIALESWNAGRSSVIECLPTDARIKHTAKGFVDDDTETYSSEYDAFNEGANWLKDYITKAIEGEKK